MLTLPPTRNYFRMIIPAYPNTGIFDQFSKRITSLGAVLIATIVDKFMPAWTVEIIDENNYFNGPRKKDGSVDHEALQQERPANVVGFYCGLSCTMPRVWQLAKWYREHGAFTVAGGWHVRYAAEESRQNGMDAVVTGDGEEAILQILSSYEQGQPDRGIFNSSSVCLDSLPIPDFGLLRFSRIRIYPIGRIRGCSMACEFCSVKGKPRWSSPEYLFQVVQWLVQTRQAKSFFITDDRIEEDKEGYIQFFQKVADQFGTSLGFTVQVRLPVVKDQDFVHVMKSAGVRHVCIGFESPIGEDLKAMHKGISVDTMVQLARLWTQQFTVHGMFIFGYPKPIQSPVRYQEMIRCFKAFIKKSKLDSIQILRPVPLIGSQLRQRLHDSGRLFPMSQVGWEYYDGNFACFQPDNMSIEELQSGPTEIMLWFYNWHSYIKLPLRTLNLPFWYPIIGWSRWYRQWWKETIKVGGHRLLKKWRVVEKKYLSYLGYAKVVE